MERSIAYGIVALISAGFWLTANALDSPEQSEFKLVALIMSALTMAELVRNYLKV